MPRMTSSEPAEPADRALLDRYATAFEKADMAALTELLRADATFEMPPLPTWFAGRATSGGLPPGAGSARARLFPADSHGRQRPARRSPPTCVRVDGVYRAHGIMVLTIAASLVTRTTMFMDPALLATFGLPPALPASGDPAARRGEGPDGTRAQNR